MHLQSGDASLNTVHIQYDEVSHRRDRRWHYALYRGLIEWQKTPKSYNNLAGPLFLVHSETSRGVSTASVPSESEKRERAEGAQHWQISPWIDFMAVYRCT